MQDADAHFVANAATGKVIARGGKILFDEVRIVTTRQPGPEVERSPRRGYFSVVSAEPMPPLIGARLRISCAPGSNVLVEVTEMSGSKVHFRRLHG